MINTRMMTKHLLISPHANVVVSALVFRHVPHYKNSCFCYCDFFRYVRVVVVMSHGPNASFTIQLGHFIF
jgi:hypothetical protein